MSKLVRLWKRPTHDGQRYTFYLIYYDVDGRRRQKALGHADERKAERHCAQFERELRMGTVEPKSMKLSKFLEDSLERTRGQVRESTLRETSIAMRSLINAIGDIDYQKVTHVHGERFMQSCRDGGNSPATVAKKLRHVKRVFKLAVERGQLEEHPLRWIRQPRVPRQANRDYSADECERLIQAARDFQKVDGLQWELLIQMALCTGMRRGELLNLTWPDIDFEQKTVDVSPKQNTEHTWEWHIKDTDRRRLPLTDVMVTLLAQHQAQQLEGYPYVFIPTCRYDHVQGLQQQGKWTVEKGTMPLNNFGLNFGSIKTRAGIDDGTFHDLRRCSLSRWIANGLSEFEVMTLAGHSKFETTRSFYLSVRKDVLDRARAASSQPISVAKLLQVPFSDNSKN